MQVGGSGGRSAPGKQGGFYDLDYNAACEPVKLSGENVIFVVFFGGVMTLIEMLLVCL